MIKHAFILGREAYLGFYISQYPMFQKYDGGPIKWFLLEKQKNM
jgi:hypothetical protein